MVYIAKDGTVPKVIPKNKRWTRIEWLARPVPLHRATKLCVIGVSSDAPIALREEWGRLAAEQPTKAGDNGKN